MATAAAPRACPAQQQQLQQLQQLLLQELPISTPAAEHSMLSSLGDSWDGPSGAKQGNASSTNGTYTGPRSSSTRSSGEVLSTLDEEFDAGNNHCLDATSRPLQHPPQVRRVSPPPLSRQELAAAGALSDALVSPAGSGVGLGSDGNRNTRSMRSKRSANNRGDDRTSPSTGGKQQKRGGDRGMNGWRGRRPSSLDGLETTQQHENCPDQMHGHSNNEKNESWRNRNSLECRNDGRCVKTEGEQSHGRGPGVSDNQLRQLGVHFSRYDNSWVARLHVGGKILKKYFSSKLYGFEKAREKALQARRDMELDLTRSQKQNQAPANPPQDNSPSFSSPAGGSVDTGINSGNGTAQCNTNIFSSTDTDVKGCTSNRNACGSCNDVSSLTRMLGNDASSNQHGQALFHSAAAASAMMLAQQQVMQQLLLLQMHSSASVASTVQTGKGGDSLIQQAVTAGYALQLEQVQRLQQLQQLQQLHQQQFAATFLLAAAGSLGENGCNDLNSGNTCVGNNKGRGSRGSGCGSGELKEGKTGVSKNDQLPSVDVLNMNRPYATSPKLSSSASGHRDGGCSTASTTTASSVGVADGITGNMKLENSVFDNNSNGLTGSGDESPFSAVATLLAAISKKDSNYNSSRSANDASANLNGFNNSGASFGNRRSPGNRLGCSNNNGRQNTSANNASGDNNQAASMQSIAALAASTLEAEFGSVCTSSDLQQQLQHQVQQQLQQLLGPSGNKNDPRRNGVFDDKPTLLPGLQSLLSSLGASNTVGVSGARSGGAGGGAGGNQEHNNQRKELQQSRNKNDYDTSESASAPSSPTASGPVNAIQKKYNSDSFNISENNGDIH